MAVLTAPEARPAPARTGTLLTVEDLVVQFSTRRGTVKAVDGVSFSLEAGERLAIVGESGSGKSVMSMSLLQLVSYPGRIVRGSAMLEGQDLLKLRGSSLRSVRGSSVTMVFQDPMTSLNPVLRVSEQITAPLRRHLGLGPAAARERAIDVLRQVGIPDAERNVDSYPHELSGGMRQRVLIAMAIACEPKLLIADEATTARDVTVQAQIVELLLRLQRERGLTIIFITHDLGLVAEICDHVAVLYMGRIVEEADTDSIFHDTRHPYTRALLAALPSERTWGRPLNVIPGSVPTAIKRIPGCSFAPRCPSVMDICRTVDPAAAAISPRHRVACHLYPAGKPQDG